MKGQGPKSRIYCQTTNPGSSNTVAGNVPPATQNLEIAKLPILLTKSNAQIVKRKVRRFYTLERAPEPFLIELETMSRPFRQRTQHMVLSGIGRNAILTKKSPQSIVTKS